jgi:hypothetical protein
VTRVASRKRIVGTLPDLRITKLKMIHEPTIKRLTENTPGLARAEFVGAKSHGNTPVFLALYMSFAIALLIACIFHERLDMLNIAYCAILFAICLGPALLGRNDPRHRMLSLFIGCYFVIFGLTSMIKLFAGEAPQALFSLDGAAGSVESPYALTSDAVVILGALAFLAGYFLISNLRSSTSSEFLTYEWPYASVLRIGVLSWAIGFALMIVYNMNVSPQFIPTHVLGLPLGIASNVRVLSPLGAVMLIYVLMRGYRASLVWTLMSIIIAAQFFFGFVSDSKQTSFEIPVLLFVGLYIAQGRVSKKLLIGMLAVAVPYLLFFDAYRGTLQERGFRTAGEAFEHFGENIGSVRRLTETQTDVISGGLGSLAERLDGKAYVDIIVAGTDSGRVGRLRGESLEWLVDSFIPRFLWPEKPDISIGQLFNHQFNLSESSFTFVPTTQLGELYWNFGMPGAIVGMLVIGIAFGQLGAVLLNHSGMTAPRFITVLMTTYCLAVRFEGNIALQYSTFARLLILIWLVDRVMRALHASEAPWRQRVHVP